MLPIERHVDAPLPLCNECPHRALDIVFPHISSLRSSRALEPLSKHVASEKCANGKLVPHPRGLTHASRLEVSNGLGCPFWLVARHAHFGLWFITPKGQVGPT